MGTPCLVYFSTGTTIEAIASHSSDGDTAMIQRDFVRFIASVERGRQFNWFDPNLAASRWCAFHLLDLWTQQWKHEEDSRINWPVLYRPGTAAITPLEMMTVRVVNNEHAYAASYVHRIDFEHQHHDHGRPFIRSLKLTGENVPSRRHSFWSPMREQQQELPDVGDYHLLRPVEMNVTGLIVPKEASGLEPALA
jgi:hypothetical protein